MQKTNGIKSVEEKYCPVVGHNVAVEVTKLGYSDISSSCLNLHDCKAKNGGCTNKFFGGRN